MESSYTVSDKLRKSAAPWFDIRHYSILDIFLHRCGTFYGWGRKRSGQRAVALAHKCSTHFILLEDGFIRSVGLGVDNAPSFSIVKDDVGIYYDATVPSRLEQTLNHYNFAADNALMEKARRAIALIRKLHISKYNHAPDIDPSRFKIGEKRVLVIAQTLGDASLKYGLTRHFTTAEMIDAAFAENPEAKVYVKIHPDVLVGKKKSDLDINTLQNRCNIITEDINPISLLEHFDTVYTKTSQMGFEALLLGKNCVCFGMPFYAGWGVTDDRVTCERRTSKRSVEEIFAAAYILYTHYYNPYSKRPTDIIDTIQTIARHRSTERPTNEQAFFFGFSRWKHAMIEPFFREMQKVNMHFINPLFGKDHLPKALKNGLDAHSRIYLWGRKAFHDVEKFAREHGNPVYRVEDGFVRSVGLGSDLTQPYSQVIDSRGIYFDPSHENDLEHLLQYYDFDADPDLIQRAASVRQHLLEKKLSKYNIFDDSVINLPKNKTVILVPGQVEDDASIRYGAPGMTNLEMLRQTRKNRPKAFIVYKPHPDVLVGNRIGKVPESEALKYCDLVVTEVSIDSILDRTDEVHTMTSLVGFEALMRGKRVTTYGLPFYAGWGLTEETQHCKRRSRVLSLDALVAGTLLLYPRYIDPETLQPCEIEVVLDALERERQRYNASLYFRIFSKIRNWLSRKSQIILRLLAGQ